MNRLPIRLRLMLPFAVAMAAVLVATGVFVYVRVGAQLLSSVDTNLRGQLAEVHSNVREGHRLIDQDVSEGPTVATVELTTGEVLAATPASLARMPLAPNVGTRRPHFFSAGIPGLRGTWRIAEQRTTLARRPVVLAVARSLAGRDETLDKLAREFTFASPVALLLAALAGYGLAAAALRPVEAMRRRAAEVGAHDPGRRLPVPPARDEIGALAVTLNDMLARLEAAFEHERRFLGDASHELRTPLALLRAELELALRRPRSHAELERAIRSAAEETDRLSQLAEDLLLVARFDQGELPVRPEPVETPQILERVRDRFAPRADALGRSVRVADAPATRVRIDPMRVEQALGNLVDNALVYGAGTVTLQTQLRDGAVELHVIDEGQGFPAGFAERAFDRFSRADDARSAGGTGLGLSIVSVIARAHGGAAHLENLPGGGSDVWISLPRDL